MINREGQRFGRLVVLSKAGLKDAGILWLCKCDCGAEKIIRAKCLASGATKSCGCLQKEIASARMTNNNPMFTREACQRMSSRVSGKGNPMYGKKRPEMTGENNPAKRLDIRKKISEAQKGRKLSLEHRKIMSENAKNRVGKLNPNYRHGLAIKENINLYQKICGSKRRAKLRNQTPNLTDIEKQYIIDIYTKAKELGPNWHVDHIIPITKGGLHHPDNLQIVLRPYNLRKSNRLDYRKPLPWEVIRPTGE